MNALLDYGTSSGEDSNDSTSSKEEQKASDKPKLPKPSLGENSLQTSVFSNPFAAAEQAKAAILEKHVKMCFTTRKAYNPIVHIIVKYIVDYCKVPGKEDTQMINGKKICWNYRKGRCRFGHKCRYAHDSDIQKTAEELSEDKKKLNTVVCESSGTMSAAPPPQAALLPTDDEVWEGAPDKKRSKRLGLSQTLVPGKKVIKMYKEQRLRDSTKK